MPDVPASTNQDENLSDVLDSWHHENVNFFWGLIAIFDVF